MKADAGDETARMRYAKVLRNLGYFQEAKAEYTLLVEKNPALLEDWYNLAAIAVELKRKGEAKKVLQHLIEWTSRSGKLSRAEAGWVHNAENYLSGVWPLDELTPLAIFEAPPPTGTARPRIRAKLP